MHPGMVLVFVAERSSLKESETEIYEEFMPRNLGSEQEYEVPFCAVRVDIAMEHINRSMKVWTIQL